MARLELEAAARLRRLSSTRNLVRLRNLKLEPRTFDHPEMSGELHAGDQHDDGDIDAAGRPVDDGRWRPPLLPPGRAVALEGRGTTWVTEAAGPPGAPTVLLLHGWTATGALNWFNAIPTLAQSYRVVTLDHRGHGRGVRSPRRFRLEDCADDAVALADHLDIDRFVAVGYSMGGPIAQLIWHRHHDRVSGLVLAATSRNFRGTPIEMALFSAMGGLSLAARVTPTQWQRQLGSRYVQRKYDDSKIGGWARSEIARNNPRSLVEAGRAIGTFSSHRWIGDVDVPTAVVVTERDSVVPPDRQRRLAESIPGAEVFPVRGDHAVCVLDPDRFVPALAAACDRVVRRGRGSHAVTERAS
jgi:3-oxoadipate enol-lactonase